MFGLLYHCTFYLYHYQNCFTHGQNGSSSGPHYFRDPSLLSFGYCVLEIFRNVSEYLKNMYANLLISHAAKSN
jgi:hypothetical protein